MSLLCHDIVDVCKSVDNVRGSLASCMLYGLGDIPRNVVRKSGELSVHFLPLLSQSPKPRPSPFVHVGASRAVEVVVVVVAPRKEC